MMSNLLAQDFPQTTPIIVVVEKPVIVRADISPPRRLVEERSRSPPRQRRHRRVVDSDDEEGPDHPMIVAEMAPVHAEELAAIPRHQQEDQFWAIIADLNWQHAIDQIMPSGPVRAAIGRLTPLRRQLFKEVYARMFADLWQIMRGDGIFDRNGIVPGRDQAKIISHMIAMGGDQYHTIRTDMAILQFFIDGGYCQSLNDLLPADIAC